MKILLISLLAFAGSLTNPQLDEAPGRTKRAVIKTSAVCEMCKLTIERAVYELEGIKRAELDIVSRNLRVRYDADLLTVDDIRQAVVMAGYRADDVPANKDAFDALPSCCQAEGACSMPGEEGGR
ncbi:MAG: heavy metal-associated domain-containing protein [Bacteroidota bacterium]